MILNTRVLGNLARARTAIHKASTCMQEEMVANKLLVIIMQSFKWL